MITLSGVSKSYRSEAGRFNALDGIDLDVGRGEMLAIVGRSGSGKSTLLHLIGGIDQPSHGTVTVNGEAIHALPENRLAMWRGRTAGIIFQFFQLMPTLTAEENVMLAMDFAGVIPPVSRRSRANDLLADFGVGVQARKLPSALSGGEQQRVAIARAMANDPPVLLADEPTGNLDSHNAASVFALLRKLADTGKTVLVVTHDDSIEELSDRTIVLTDGTIATRPRVAGLAR